MGSGAPGSVGAGGGNCSSQLSWHPFPVSTSLFNGLPKPGQIQEYIDHVDLPEQEIGQGQLTRTSHTIQ